MAARETMKAVMISQYGAPEDVLVFREDYPKPVPNDSEVLVRIRAAALNPFDWHVVRAKPFVLRAMYGWFGLRYPIGGADLSGTVERVGKHVTKFQVGDEVIGDMGLHGLGAWAEFVCAKEIALARKPSNMPLEDAAGLPVCSTTALLGLRDQARIKEGDSVLVIGASGGVGTAAVQIAKHHLGAHVTAVCSAANADLVKSIGADHVIDYKSEDWAKNGQQYDLIMDHIQDHTAVEYEASLRPGGLCISNGANAKLLVSMWLRWPANGKRLEFAASNNMSVNLPGVVELVESGKITCVVGHRFTLKELPEAMRLLETGHARGKIIIGI